MKKFYVIFFVLLICYSMAGQTPIDEKKQNEVLAKVKSLSNDYSLNLGNQKSSEITIYKHRLYDFINTPANDEEYDLFSRVADTFEKNTILVRDSEKDSKYFFILDYDNYSPIEITANLQIDYKTEVNKDFFAKYKDKVFTLIPEKVKKQLGKPVVKDDEFLITCYWPLLYNKNKVLNRGVLLLLDKDRNRIILTDSTFGFHAPSRNPGLSNAKSFVLASDEIKKLFKKNIYLKQQDANKDNLRIADYLYFKEDPPRVESHYIYSFFADVYSQKEVIGRCFCFFDTTTKEVFSFDYVRSKKNEKIDEVQAFFNSCRKAKKGELLEFLKTGSDPNMKNPKALGETPIMAAISENQLENVKILLKSGADINLADNYGMTPLMTLAANPGCKKDMVKFVLKKSRNINQISAIGETVLHIAAANGNATFLQSALEWYKNVNVLDKDGDTPLNEATLNFDDDENYKKTIKVLLDAGADPNLKNKEGQSALDIAKEEENDYLIDLFSKSAKK